MTETKPQGVIVTLAEIHNTLTQVSRDTLEMKGQLSVVVKVEKDLEEIEKRVNKIDTIIAAHSVIIALVTSGVGAALIKVFTV